MTILETERETGIRISRSESRSARRSILRDRIAPYAFLAPFLISFLIFFVVPSVYSVVLSLFQYRGYGAMRFVGLSNYAAIFASPSFWQSIANTAFYWLVPVVPLMGFGLLLALAVRSRVVRWGRVYKPLLFIPQVMAPVAASIVWTVILSNNGVLNSVFGLDVAWLSDPDSTKWAVSMLLVWRSVGWYFVIFLSALTSISSDVLEAAEVDGATPTQKLRFIILPLLKPIFLFAIVIDTIGSIQLYTEPNLLLGSGSGSLGAPPSGAPLMNQVVQNITGGQFGLASAVGWLIFIAIGIFSAIQFRLLGERKE